MNNRIGNAGDTPKLFELIQISRHRNCTRIERTRTHRRALNRYLKGMRRIAALKSYERMFAAWHVLHTPLFIILFVTAVFHVVAVHMY